MVNVPPPERATVDVAACATELRNPNTIAVIASTFRSLFRICYLIADIVLRCNCVILSNSVLLYGIFASMFEIHNVAFRQHHGVCISAGTRRIICYIDSTELRDKLADRMLLPQRISGHGWIRGGFLNRLMIDQGASSASHSTAESSHKLLPIRIVCTSAGLMPISPVQNTFIDSWMLQTVNVWNCIYGRRTPLRGA